jgi:hypothetical protein
MSVTLSIGRARVRWVGRRVLGPACASVLVGACHFGGSGEPMVTFRVQNNLVPAASLTISLIPAAGSRRTIGVVGPSRTEELRVPRGSDADPHRLMAEVGSGPATTSRQFAIVNASVVEWNVGANILNVSERR